MESWCNLADVTFDLPEESQSSSPGPELLQFRLEGSALQELSKSGRGELIPISPRGATPPSIIARHSRRRIAASPDPNDSMTPKSTPVKILPFSPSQVRLCLWPWPGMSHIGLDFVLILIYYYKMTIKKKLKNKKWRGRNNTTLWYTVQLPRPFDAAHLG